MLQGDAALTWKGLSGCGIYRPVVHIPQPWRVNIAVYSLASDVPSRIEPPTTNAVISLLPPVPNPPGKRRHVDLVGHVSRRLQSVPCHISPVHRRTYTNHASRIPQPCPTLAALLLFLISPCELALVSSGVVTSMGFLLLTS